MTKPIDEMTLEELRAERAALAEGDTAVPEWAHDHLDYAGLSLEVRKPNESALIAISMTGVPALGSQGQMRIFTQFLVNHLSAESFATVVESMTDPDSGVDINGLIQKLTELTTKSV